MQNVVKNEIVFVYRYSEALWGGTPLTDKIRKVVFDPFPKFYGSFRPNLWV